MTLIASIIKKIIAEDFVQFKDGNLMHKGQVIDTISAPPSSGNATNELYIAYASAPDGTGFTLTSSDDLEYIAFKTLPVGTTPIANHFSGAWYHRKGLPGTNATGLDGTNGEPAGVRMNMSTVISAAKPGTGKFRFNNADISLATEMYVDEMMPSAVDISGFFNQWLSGAFFMLKPNTNFNSPLAIFKLTDDPVDNGDWFTIPVQNLAMSAETFLDEAKCVLQYYGGGGGGSASVTSAAILSAGNFLRAADNGAGGYKIIDNANAELESALQVFKLPGITASGVSNIPAANTFPNGAVVRLHQNVLVGAGANPLGVLVVADATNNIWRPLGNQALFWKNFGTTASPTLSLTAAGEFNLGSGGNPVIPAGLLYAGAKLTFYMRWRKVGTTTPSMRIWLGTDLAAKENNSYVYAQQALATANMDVPGKSELTFVTATSAICSNRASTGGGGAANTVIDADTLINVASAMKATFEANILSGDTVHLLEMGIVWRN